MKRQVIAVLIALNIAVSLAAPKQNEAEVQSASENSVVSRNVFISQVQIIIFWQSFAFVHASLHKY